MEVPRDYSGREPGETVDRFIERVSDYGAGVTEVGREEIASALANLCRAAGILRIVVPTDIPADWLPEDVEAVADVDLEIHALDDDRRGRYRLRPRDRGDGHDRARRG